MAIEIVTNSAVSVAGTPAALTKALAYGVKPTAGNRALLFISRWLTANTKITVADDATIPDTFTKVTEHKSANDGTYIFSAPINTGNEQVTTTVAATASVSSYLTMCLLELSGVDPIAAIHASNSVASALNTDHTVQITTTRANCKIYGVISSTNGMGTVTANSPCTEVMATVGDGSGSPKTRIITLDAPTPGTYNLSWHITVASAVHMSAVAIASPDTTPPAPATWAVNTAGNVVTVGVTEADTPPIAVADLTKITLNGGLAVQSATVIGNTTLGVMLDPTDRIAPGTNPTLTLAAGAIKDASNNLNTLSAHQITAGENASITYSAITGLPTSILATSPKHLWLPREISGNFADAGFSPTDGTEQGTGTTRGVGIGQYYAWGRGVTFNGSGYIDCGSNGAFDQGDKWSVSVAIQNAGTPSGTAKVVSKMNGSNVGWSLSDSGVFTMTGTGSMAVALNDQTLAIHERVLLTVVVDTTANPGQTLAANVTYYLNGRALTVANGGLTATKNNLTGSIANAATLQIGAQNGTASFVGTVGLVGIWNRALSSAEVATFKPAAGISHFMGPLATVMAFPGACRRPTDGKLFAVFNDGSRDGNGANIYCISSTDNGVTWSAIGDPLYTIDDSTNGYVGDVRIGCTTEGTLIISFFVQSQPAKTYAGAKGVFCLRSTDGTNWTAGASKITVKAGTGWAASGRMIEYDGKMIIPLYNESGSPTVLSFVSSTDDGLTWGNDVTVCSSVTTYTELCLWPLANGSLVGFARDDTNVDIVRFISTDGHAAVWSEPAICIAGCSGTPVPIQIPSGRVFVAHRQAGNGLCEISYSDDNGETFTTLYDLVDHYYSGGWCWDTESQTLVLVTNKSTTGTKHVMALSPYAAADTDAPTWSAAVATGGSSIDITCTDSSGPVLPAEPSGFSFRYGDETPIVPSSIVRSGEFTFSATMPDIIYQSDTVQAQYNAGDVTDAAGNAMSGSELWSDVSTSGGSLHAAPEAPTGLTATASIGKIDLAWTAGASEATISNYKVYRDGSLLATLGNVLLYTDATAVPGTQYTYTVAAVNVEETEGAESNEATGTALAASGSTWLVTKLLLRN